MLIKFIKFLGKLVLKLFSIGFIFVITMIIGLALYASTLIPGLPTVDEIRRIPLNIPLRIYSSDHKLIAEYGNERRIPVTLDQSPPLLIDAILATEDDRFYHHTGVDFPGLARAAVSNFLTRSRSQGASTITMQVARNFFLNPEKTYTRKLKEILLAFNMERALTKDEILELYLNKIFLGHRSYGFAAAAQVYYGVDLPDLSLPEIAMLAGLPKAPSRDNPISNPKRAVERRAYVLKRLYELGKIDGLSLQTASNAPITAQRHVADVDLQAPYVSEMARQLLYERFGEQVYHKGLNVTLTVNSEHQSIADEALRKGILDYDIRHGYKGPLRNLDLGQIEDKERADFIAEILEQFPPSRNILPAVVTNVNDQTFTAINSKGDAIDVEWENMKWARKYIGPNNLGAELKSAHEIVSAGDVIYLREFEENIWMLSQIPEVSGALVSLNPHTGAILALTGGFDYYFSKFNRATQAERQPGSNIKPFIYSAAFDNGFTPASLVSATPIIVEDDLEGIWKPQNYSRKFFGPTRLRKALSLSLNLVSVRLLRAMGLETVIDHLAKFGFDPDKLPENLSLALGSITITPLDLAANFSVIANGGHRIVPYLIEKIEDRDGNPIELSEKICEDCQAESADTGQILSKISAQPGSNGAAAKSPETNKNVEAENPPGHISPENAFLTRSIMKQAIRTGTGRRALALNRSDLAGKTGTTNNFRDAWFSGFSSDVLTTVFIGFDEPSHLGKRESGARAALPIWIDFMAGVLPDYPEKPETVPDSIITRFINKDTAEATSDEDPDGYWEYYLTGTEPDNIIQPENESGGKTKESLTESLF